MMSKTKLQPSLFAPVQQGSFSHFDASIEKHLVETFDVPTEKISSCVVCNNVSGLYNAILEYSALCPHPIQPQTSRHFFIQSSEPFMAAHREKHVISRRHSSRSRKARSRSIISTGSGTTRPKAPKTNLKMDLGHTLITWPPPKHLEPEFLSKIGCHEPYALCNKLEGKGLLHIMHYEVGTPQKSGFGNKISSLQIVRVSTAQGDMFLKEFLDGILQWRLDRANPNHLGSKYNLYRFKADGCGGEWREQGLRRSRPHQSVILSKGKMKEILDDIEHFLHVDSKKWHIEHGLPHRRSYLFEGPPGTGKTSTIRVIAGKFGLSCCFLSMTDEKFSNQLLADALSSLPSNALLVLEDVDSLFKADRTSANSASFTFSGVLNCLDGVLSSEEGHITIMTTNHAERLDAALIRGGRVDKRFYFAAPDKNQIGNLFRHFYQEASDQEVEKFLQEVRKTQEAEKWPPITTLQQLFIACRGQTSQDCIERADTFLKEWYEAVKNDK